MTLFYVFIKNHYLKSQCLCFWVFFVFFFQTCLSYSIPSRRPMFVLKARELARLIQYPHADLQPYPEY